MRERNKAVLPVGRICGSSCESSEEWLGGGRAVKEVVVVEGEDARPTGMRAPSAWTWLGSGVICGACTMAEKSYIECRTK